MYWPGNSTTTVSRGALDMFGAQPTNGAERAAPCGMTQRQQADQLLDEVTRQVGRTPQGAAAQSLELARTLHEQVLKSAQSAADRGHSLSQLNSVRDALVQAPPR